MKKSDIRVGVEYAVGSSREGYDWRRAVVVDVDAQAPVRDRFTGRTLPGQTTPAVRVRYLGPVDYLRGRADANGEELVQPREVHQAWAEFEAERERKEAARQAKDDVRVAALARVRRAAEALAVVGFPSAALTYVSGAPALSLSDVDAEAIAARLAAAPSTGDTPDA